MGYEDSVYLAKLAEQAERYEGWRLQIWWIEYLTKVFAEMVENMKSVASEDQELSVEERNLLSVAYKNVIGARRASWRIVTSIEQKEESKGNSTQVTLIKEYRQKIEAELAKICEDILEVLDQHLIPSAKSGESKVFYHKMFVSTMTAHIFSANILVGRETTTVTLLSLPSVTSERSPPTSLSRLTRTPPKSPKPILLQPTQSALAWPSTSPSSTMRSSIPPIRRATLLSKLLMMLLLVSNWK
jgi:hypothetical protein